MSACTQRLSSQVRGAPFYITFIWFSMWDNTRGAQIEVLTKVAQEYKLEPTLGPVLKCLPRLDVFSVSCADACPLSSTSSPHRSRILALVHRSCTHALLPHISPLPSLCTSSSTVEEGCKLQPLVPKSNKRE